jgi:hypothetical protein
MSVPLDAFFESPALLRDLAFCAAADDLAGLDVLADAALAALDVLADAALPVFPATPPADLLFSGLGLLAFTVTAAPSADPAASAGDGGVSVSTVPAPPLAASAC